ncbi:uncharacterized protein LOC121370122 [Gigantopelta aegis]|uniref:uncharacterized protein LOC121370122 n=1 Tax=Gigantopelta aegis TaxID=1735272 RepID=UPI001B88AB59|nr:uncharacterized protein LOC121370122 [Gigantopelta aegis]
MGFINSSLLVKVALGACIASFLFHLISFTTPYWFEQGGSNSGLFRSCPSGVCVDIPEASKSDKLKATIAMELLAFLVGVACLVLMICHLLVESLATKLIMIICMILAFVTAFLILLGVIVFAAANNQSVVTIDYGWSFALEIIAAIMYIATGAVFVVDIVTGS